MINAKFKKEMPLYFMVLPGIVLVLIYCYGPMFGLVMAFQDYDPTLGFFRSPWVNLDNFKYILSLPDTVQVLNNTIFIAGMKIIFETFASILIAILLNEVNHKFFKKTIQTIIYFPYFLSWIVLGGILRNVLSIDGILNKFLAIFGVNSIMFLGNVKAFPYLLVITDAWQQVGFGTIIYLAAITNINPALYEASAIDGANRWKQTIHITLQGMKPIIVLMATLSLGNILNAGFDQIYVLYSPLVYQSGDVIDTWVFRMGLINAQYSVAAAVGLFRSLVSFILIGLSYFFAHKYADYRIF